MMQEGNMQGMQDMYQQHMGEHQEFNENMQNQYFDQNMQNGQNQYFDNMQNQENRYDQNQYDQNQNQYNNNNNGNTNYMWNGTSYSDYNDYRTATYYDGTYYLPEENGLYNDYSSAFSAWQSAQLGVGGFTPTYWGATLYNTQSSYDAARTYNGVQYTDYNTWLSAQNAGNQVLEIATSGNDTLYASGSTTAVGQKVMSPSMDYDLGDGDDLIGGPSADLQGDDYIKGGNGDDVIYGGSGSDWLDGDNDDDHIFGGAGNDILLGGEGADVLYGGSGQNILYAGGTTVDLQGVYAFNSNNTQATEVANAQDTFVFYLGEGGNMMGASEIVGWEDGSDKIMFSRDGGSTYVSNPFADNAYGAGLHSFVDTYSNGVTMVHAGNNANPMLANEYYFGVEGNVTFDDGDVVTSV